MEKNMRDGSRSQSPAPKPFRPKASTAAARPDAEAVARRAYEKFCERGYQHGFDQQDWLAAERELAPNRV